jgi:hypothetical protein
MSEEFNSDENAISQNGNERRYSNLYSVKEFSKAYKIGINTVYRLCKLNDFPFIQIGGKIYIVADEFILWVNKNRGKVV